MMTMTPKPFALLRKPFAPLLLLLLFAPPAPAQDDPERWRVLTLPAPEFKRAPPGPTPAARRGPRLVAVSERRNQVTDVVPWFERNGLELPVYELPGEEGGEGGRALPGFVPLRFRGVGIVRAMRGPSGGVLAVYGLDGGEGRYLVALDPAGRFRYGFDFEAYAYAPAASQVERRFTYQQITWAAEDAGTLYVSHGHNTYARSSKGMNAYLTALDTRTGRVLWRSPPLVSNASNFELAGGLLVAGYGFTSEPDFLYLLDKRTGEVRQRLSIRSGPTYILRKGDRLYVRAYDADLVLKLSGL
ncbi:MAG TPA: hypothetical protein VGX48_13455 [Pyrinomonadaceae bacterium]|jgi:hypothetical protein|nr:hypothetical protein [Pyrinomonadaceae bacterium]